MSVTEKADAERSPEPALIPETPAKAPHWLLRRPTLPSWAVLGLWPTLMIVAAFLLAAAAVALYFYLSHLRPAPAASADAIVVGKTALSQEQSSSEPAPSAAQVSVRQFEDWALVCPADASSQTPCLARQQLVSSSNALVLTWTLQRDEKGVLHALWQVPTGLLVNKGMVLDLGDGRPSAIPFSSCDAHFCTAKAVIAPDYLIRLENAKEVSAKVATGEKTFAFRLSSRGIAQAVAGLQPQ